jgi:hypothetical protein
MTFGFAEELHRIEDARRTNPSSFTIVARWSVSLAGLKEHIAKARPDVVHVLSPTVDPAKNEIILSDERGRPEYVPMQAFAAAFARRAAAPKLVVINTCHSRPLAEAVSKHVGCAVSMDGEISDAAAIEFSDALYHGLAEGKSVADAFDLARDAVKKSEPKQSGVPLLLAGRADPNAVRIAESASTSASAGAPGTPTPTASQKPHCVQIFCSFSHRDSKYRDELEVHLANLRAQGLVEVWHDRLIKPGTDWALDIDHNLDQANVVLLLVSADFMASQYCMGIELRRALDRQKTEGVRVVPILVRECDLKGAPFTNLQWLPTGSKPVKKWTDRDSAWTNVVGGIRTVVEELRRATG